MNKTIKRCIGACKLHAKRAHRTFSRLMAKRLTGFLVSALVGYIIFRVTGHPLAFLSLLERSLDWVGASASDALIEAEKE